MTNSSPAPSAAKPAPPGKSPAPTSAPAPSSPASRQARGPPAGRSPISDPGLPAAERARRSQEVIELLQTSFPEVQLHSRAGVLSRVQFPREDVVRVCTWLRDKGTFGHCAMVGAVDWRETREIVYLLWSDVLRTYLELTTSVPGDDPHLESVSGVWQGANWHEREAWDLVGVRFDHHPDLRRLFLHEGYQFHPLLKSFELHEPEQLEVKARLSR